MVPLQQVSFVWATGIVIKRLRVHHTLLPRPPSLRLGVFHILLHCLQLLLNLLILYLLLLHVHIIILFLMLRFRLRLDISTTSPGTPTPQRNITFLLHLLETLSPTRSMPCHPYALSGGGTFCNMHKTQYKTGYQKPFWVFLDFIFRIATILSEK